MKGFQFISVILLSYLLVSSNAAITLVLSSSDSVTTATFPASLVLTGGATTSVTANPSTNIPAPSGTSGVYTARFTSGIPVNQVWTLTNDAAGGSPAITGLTILLTLGSQVSLSVTPSGTQTAGTVQTSATSVTPSTTTCGNYLLDCQAGTLLFNMYIPVTAATTCIVTINQVAAIVGILQYTTATVPTTSTVSSAITTANSGTNAATTICSTQVSGTNTLYYFISTFGSATGSDQTTNYGKVRSAAVLGNLGGNTAYYTANLQTSLTGGSTAPSAQASSLTAISKSSTKLVAVVGLMTTVVATLFGFAL